MPSCVLSDPPKTSGVERYWILPRKPKDEESLMTAKRAQKIVAVMDDIEDHAPEIAEDALFTQTAFKLHCEREDVGIALATVNELEARNE